MSAQTNRMAAGRRVIGLIAGAAALAFSAPAWAEPVGLVCVFNGRYSDNGSFERYDGDQIPPSIMIFDEDEATIQVEGGVIVPALTTNDRIIGLIFYPDAGYIESIVINRFDLSVISGSFVSNLSRSDHPEIFSLWSDVNTAAKRQAFVAAAMRLWRLSRRGLSEQCSVQQRGL